MDVNGIFKVIIYVGELKLWIEANKKYFKNNLKVVDFFRIIRYINFKVSIISVI